MTYGVSYRPFRNKPSYCINNNCPTIYVDRYKHNSIYRTQPLIFSSYINTATYYPRSGYTRSEFSNRELNRFGYWEGAPGGYGSVLRNKY